MATCDCSYSDLQEGTHVFVKCNVADTDTLLGQRLVLVHNRHSCHVFSFAQDEVACSPVCQLKQLSTVQFHLLMP